MTDGTGTTQYGYDALARLRHEARTFNGLAGSYRLDYQYNLTGQLTRLSLHGNVHVEYVRDYAGQVTAVGNTGYADNQPYATGIRYRTSGAVTGMTYGNGRTLSLGYDHRLRLARWDVAGLMGWDYHYNFFNEKTGRVTFADSLYDNTLDRSYEYDQVGRLAYSWTGTEAHAHAYSGQWGVPDGPYAHGYRYDERGNLVERQGWGGWNASVSYPFDSQNRNTLLSYDAAGNVTGDGSQLSYDATGQQVSAIYSAPGGWDIQQGYDGDRQRVKKVEAGQTTYCLRSTVLGGQVVAEYNQSGDWTRGYVYDGGAQLLAVQQNNAVNWIHTDPVTKSKRVTDRQGAFLSAIDVDPWGGETSKIENGGTLSRKYTTYERDGNGRDQAMMRSYHAWFSRFDQPDPFDGSYDLTNPQTLNRYAYVNNDPVNFVDPLGLDDDPSSRPRNVRPENPMPNYWWSHYLYRRWNFRPQPYRLEDPRGGGSVPPNTEPQEPPCPPVPQAPDNANLNANIREADKRRRGVEAIPKIAMPVLGTAISAHQTWFANQVRPGGVQDYKQQDVAGGTYIPFGNFNFGAVGAAAGFSEGQLLRAAGFVQKWFGDTPGDGGRVNVLNALSGSGGQAPFQDQNVDQENIRLGILYYQRGCHMR